MHALFTGVTVRGPVQPSRLGAADGAVGAGINDWLRASAPAPAPAKEGPAHG
jgi:hypothetical protein